MRLARAVAAGLVLLALAPAGASDAAPREPRATKEKAAKSKKRDAKPRAKAPAEAGARREPRSDTQRRPKTEKGAKRRVAQLSGAARMRAGSNEPEAKPKHDQTSSRARALSILPAAIRCPADMVAVAGRVCVDRYEASLVEVGSGRRWSPFYAPDRERAQSVFAFYTMRMERSAPDRLEATLPLPPLPDFEPRLRAVSEPGVLPQGYTSGEQAEVVCAAAGKRLCTEAEWVTACRGEEQRDFPYGQRYEQGTCNVFREHHPSMLLHGNASRYHDDPRNPTLVVEGRTLLLETGASPRCASRWGDDAVFDMVGNLDEWIASDEGVFVGGFYSRGTRSGCASRVSNHVKSYADYSTGVRCCSDPETAAR